MAQTPKFYNEADLLDRLRDGLVDENGRQFTFMFGAGAGYEDGVGGTARTSDVVEGIQRLFSGEAETALSQKLATGDNPYQDGFDFLIGRRGPDAAKQVIKQAVWNARKPSVLNIDGNLCTGPLPPTDELCRLAEEDTALWIVPAAMKAVAEIAARAPKRINRHILSTNFDPLLSVALSERGVAWYRTVLHRDGDITQTAGSGMHIIHLHGYWYGHDPLNTTNQLEQQRPRLRAQLANVVSDSAIVIFGYSGWNDVITDVLSDIVESDGACPEIIWCLYGGAESLDQKLIDRLSAGISRARVNFFTYIDCHSFFPKLAASLPDAQTDTNRPHRVKKPAQPILLRPAPIQEAGPVEKRRIVIPKFFGDTPPSSDFFVGRVESLSLLKEQRVPTAFISGLGGQGKSILASRYFREEQESGKFDACLWLDCREQAERFESNIALITSILSRGNVEAYEISKLPTEELCQLFVSAALSYKILVVFDNVDHYVDLETGVIGGAPGRFVEFTQSLLDSRFVFTCRPQITSDYPWVTSHRLQGLSLDAAIDLFKVRGATVDRTSIEVAHAQTNGHALWLDLLAAQVSKPGNSSDLLKLLPASGSSDKLEIPKSTLMSIWNGLNERERFVLRAMAETIRPLTDYDIADILRRSINFKNVQRAIASLRLLSLIVVKDVSGSEQILELHPLLKAFIRQSFPKSERNSYIDDIIRSMLTYIGVSPPTAAQYENVAALKRWVELAELYIERGDYAKAISQLVLIIDPLVSSSIVSELVRVMDRVLDSCRIVEIFKVDGFENCFSSYIDVLGHLGRKEKALSRLAEYRLSIEGKGVRYINYCSLMCHTYWILGEFDEAVKWGQEGVSLKTASNVDTQFDASHNLALAQRDAGLIEPALERFLLGENLSDIVKGDVIDRSRGGAFYGNIGRCLQLMGQTGPSLICYKKSARLIESIHDGTRSTNQAYIRQWVGETKISSGDKYIGQIFLKSAAAKWENINPNKASEVRQQLSKASNYIELPNDDVCEDRFLSWQKSDGGEEN